MKKKKNNCNSKFDYQSQNINESIVILQIKSINRYQINLNIKRNCNYLLLYNEKYDKGWWYRVKLLLEKIDI